CSGHCLSNDRHSLGLPSTRHASRRGRAVRGGSVLPCPIRRQPSSNGTACLFSTWREEQLPAFGQATRAFLKPIFLASRKPCPPDVFLRAVAVRHHCPKDEHGRRRSH